MFKKRNLFFVVLAVFVSVALAYTYVRSATVKQSSENITDNIVHEKPAGYHTANNDSVRLPVAAQGQPPKTDGTRSDSAPAEEGSAKNATGPKQVDWIGLQSSATATNDSVGRPIVTTEAFSLARFESLPKVNERIAVRLTDEFLVEGTVILSHQDDKTASLGVTLSEEPDRKVLHLDFNSDKTISRGTILAPHGQLSYVITPSDAGLVTIKGVARSEIVPDDDGSYPPAQATDPGPQNGGGAGGEGGGEIAFGFDPAETFLLHSKPTASKVIYLDFDGHTTAGTIWNSSYGTIVTPAYSTDGSAAFQTSELQNIYNIWQRVSEDFAPFDVDVTTEDPGIERLRNTGGSDTQWGIRVVVGGSSSWLGQSAGGVAYVGSFSWNSDTPVFVFEDNLGNGNEKYVAEATSHEVGHSVGLSHDGTSSVGYYQGHGSGEIGWAPIMGVGYYRELTQWSKGEYAGANNLQDDLFITTSYYGFGYRADDHGNTNGTATAISFGTSHDGIIERQGDLDVFSFTLGSGGAVSANIAPFERSPNLDIKADLYNSSGSLIATSNPAASLAAQLSVTLAAGQYFLVIDGAANANASDYASLGQYTVVLSGGEPAASVSFEGVDALTKGSWTGTATGGEGYVISQVGQSLPSYASVNLSGFNNHVWASSVTGDARAVEKPSAGDRIAACWYHPSYFDANVTISGSIPKLVDLYFLDWDSYGPRNQRVDVIDVASGIVLDSRSVQNYMSGQHYIWEVLGAVKFRVVNLNGGSNATLSAIFFNDANGNPPTATPTNTPVPPTATPTRTNTPVPPTATPTQTNTPVPPTATPTRTNTPVPPTATPTQTNTPVPPTATPTRTNTPVPPTATPTQTNTPVPPTATPTRTNTPVGATATPTHTNTPVPPTATATNTNTPVSPPATPTSTSTPQAPSPTPTSTPGGPPQSAAFFIDDGDPGFVSGADWNPCGSTAFQSFGKDCRYQNTSRRGTAAKWSAPVQPGWYRISTTWQPISTAWSYATYRVIDGSKELGRETFDQSKRPRDFSDREVLWSDIGKGTFYVQGPDLTIELLGYPILSRMIVADAVRLERLSPAGAPPPLEGSGSIEAPNANNQPPVAIDASYAARPSRWRKVFLSAIDPEGRPLTYRTAKDKKGGKLKPLAIDANSQAMRVPRAAQEWWFMSSTAKGIEPLLYAEKNGVAGQWILKPASGSGPMTTPVVTDSTLRLAAGTSLLMTFIAKEDGELFLSYALKDLERRAREDGVTIRIEHEGRGTIASSKLAEGASLISDKPIRVMVSAGDIVSFIVDPNLSDKGDSIQYSLEAWYGNKFLYMPGAKRRETIAFTASDGLVESNVGHVRILRRRAKR